MHTALCAAFDEADPAAFMKDPNPQPSPAFIFIWESVFFRKRIYLKFKLKGPRPTLWILSCHEAYF